MTTNPTLLVATHKPYWMPADPAYLPLHVGAEGEDVIDGFQRDDEGENISRLNPHFCELTGVYWAWKNLQADSIGLVHYRRYFAVRVHGHKKGRIATGDDLRAALAKAPIVLPTERNYYIETNRSQYVHAHHEIDLDMTRRIIEEKYPDYLEAYDASMARTHGHRFNMFVMRRDYFDQYCQWLFDILFKLERRLDISEYSAYDQRVFGFISERLLDPWIETNGIAYTQMPVVNLENQHWGRKILTFLKRKIGVT